VVVDVPSGRLQTEARVENGRVASVRFRNVPAFVHARGLTAAGREVDVAFGGAFYASLEEQVEPAELPRLIELGRAIKADLEQTHAIVHPDEPELRDVYGVIFWQDESAKPLTQRNVTVFADGEVDRSPCGSGTSARLALLHDEGRLATGEPLRHLSIVGSEFTGRVVEETPAGVVTEIEGSAHLTGRHEFVLEPDDELGEGFLLR
jgi:proline racemase/trans-L-3-hydroxyproline dehydratase